MFRLDANQFFNFNLNQKGTVGLSLEIQILGKKRFQGILKSLGIDRQNPLFLSGAG